MSKDQKIEALKAIGIFSGCTDKELASIANVTEWVSVPEGHKLLTEGHVGHDMFVLDSGTADVQIGGGTIATVKQGDVVGELGLVDGKRASATVVANQDVEGWLVPRRGFLPLLEADPALARPLLDAVIEKLRATDEQLH